MPKCIFGSVVCHSVHMSKSIEELNGTSHTPLVKLVLELIVSRGNNPLIKRSPNSIVYFNLSLTTSACIINQLSVSIVTATSISRLKGMISVKAFVFKAPSAHIQIPEFIAVIFGVSSIVFNNNFALSIPVFVQN